MAVDQALSESVRRGGAPILRFYRWSPACLSLGRNQPARGLYDLAALGRAGVDVVRRPTGGRAVLHDRELTYSAIFPERFLGPPRQAYRTINRALVAGLRRLGVPAGLAVRRGRSPVPSTAPCFAEPAEGEVVVAGRKLLGSAQRRESGVILQHGSLLLAGSQERAQSFLLDPSASTAPSVAATTLEEVCGIAPEWSALTRALVEGWAEVVGAELRAVPLAPAEHAAAAPLAARFAESAWTWHR